MKCQIVHIVNLVAYNFELAFILKKNCEPHQFTRINFQFTINYYCCTKSVQLVWPFFVDLFSKIKQWQTFAYQMWWMNTQNYAVFVCPHRMNSIQSMILEKYVTRPLKSTICCRNVHRLRYKWKYFIKWTFSWNRFNWLSGQKLRFGKVYPQINFHCTNLARCIFCALLNEISLNIYHFINFLYLTVQFDRFVTTIHLSRLFASIV